jgi:hypothetical protein
VKGEEHMPVLSAPTIDRLELEASWRQKVEGSQDRYQAASANYKALKQESPEGLIARSNSPLALARRAEAEALTEYITALMSFTDLAVYRRIPRQESAEGLVNAISD